MEDWLRGRPCPEGDGTNRGNNWAGASVLGTEVSQAGGCLRGWEPAWVCTCVASVCVSRQAFLALTLAGYLSALGPWAAAQCWLGEVAALSPSLDLCGCSVSICPAFWPSQSFESYFVLPITPSKGSLCLGALAGSPVNTVAQSGVSSRCVGSRAVVTKVRSWDSSWGCL